MEASTIKFSQIEDRIDAEYYKPEYLILSSRLKNQKSKTLEDLSQIITKGETPLWRGDVYVQKGVPFLRVVNFINEGLDLSDIVYIPEFVHQRMKRSQLKPGDVLLSMAGRIGTAVIVPEDLRAANINQAIAKIRLREGIISKYYLITFLNSKYGLLQSLRRASGGVQNNINFEDIKSIKVPIPSQSFQQKIEKMVKEAQEKRKLADEKYKEAEEILNKELGLGDLDLSTQKTFEAKFSEARDRLDPGYYQPKYKRVISKLKTQKAKSLGEMVKIRKGIEVGHEAYTNKGKSFIRVQDYNEREISIGKNTDFIRDYLYEKLKKDHRPLPGEIIYSKDGTVGRAFVVSKDNCDFIVSGGILILTPKDIDSYYLALALNSPIVKSQVIRESIGAIIQHLSIGEVRKLKIPILSESVQQKISELAQQSFKLRREAKELIDRAKKEVEEMVERGK